MTPTPTTSTITVGNTSEYKHYGEIGSQSKDLDTQVKQGKSGSTNTQRPSSSQSMNTRVERLTNKGKDRDDDEDKNKEKDKKDCDKNIQLVEVKGKKK